MIYKVSHNTVVLEIVFARVLPDASAAKFHELFPQYVEMMLFPVKIDSDLE